MEISINDIVWKEFSVTKLFKIERGNRLIISKRIKGNIPLVTAGFKNEGVADFISNDEQKTYNNAITIDMFGNVFYRGYEFKCDDNIHILTNSNFTKNISLFVCNCIKQTTENIFNYGKQFRLKTIEKLKILLPVNENDELYFAFMEQYIQQKENEKLLKYQLYIQKRIEKIKDFKKVESIEKKEWKEFFLNEIFPEIQRGKRLKKDDHIKGQMPYVSSSALNNGIDGFVSNDKSVRIFSNCLSLANSGSVGATFYQPFKYVASDHVTKLENIKYNEFIYLFISTIAKRLSEKYSFNREINDQRIKREKIVLPIDENEQPDYDYMENYIKKIEYEKLTKYIERKTPNG